MTADIAHERALDPNLLGSVYGFGVFVGTAFGQLLGLPYRARARRADLCGRFNLGISLFDYVSDEGSDADRVALHSLPSLRLFSETTQRSPHVAATQLRYLDQVVADVLATFMRELGPPPAKSRRQGLWRALFSMFEAEILRTRLNLNYKGSLDPIRKALQLSAAEPFRVMADWMARPLGIRMRRRASYLGRCVGDCYWLIDDAKDVWDDLHASRWNYFLLAAKRADPALSLTSPSPFLAERLMELWQKNQIAKRSARYTVSRLARAIDGLGVECRKTRQLLMALHASMLSWYG